MTARFRYTRTSGTMSISTSTNSSEFFTITITSSNDDQDDDQYNEQKRDITDVLDVILNQPMELLLYIQEVVSCDDPFAANTLNYPCSAGFHHTPSILPMFLTIVSSYLFLSGV
jgi:hypothetical protein